MRMTSWTLLAVLGLCLALVSAHGWGYRGGYRGRHPRRGGALFRMACQVTDAAGDLIRYRRCYNNAECSIGPVTVDWEDDKANLLFCSDSGAFLYEAACLTRSTDPELDTERGCRVEDSTCSVGPITVELDDSPVEVTFCTKPEGGCGFRRPRAPTTPSPASPAEPTLTPGTPAPPTPAPGAAE